jgi:undecaprenyl-diphosphatase
LSLVHALVLALVQAVTEFLPISSSAHLILVPVLFGWADQGLSFDIATHAGTTLAVLAYFRRDLRDLVAGLLGRAAAVEGLPPGRFLAALAVGTVPAGVAGLLAHDWVATVGRNPRLLAGTLIGFGFVLAVADRWGTRRRDLSGLTLPDALLVGLAQALALVPGTSRSGITMTAALLLGYRRPAAARFSFLLAIPVGVLATAYDGFQMATGRVPAVGLPAVAAAVAVSAAAGYLVIGGLLAWLQRQSFTPFVVYRVALGVAILVLVG